MSLPILNENLLEEDATKPLTEVRVNIIFYIFTVHSFVSLFCVLIGAIPYYHYFGKTNTTNGFIISVTISCFFYLLMAIFTSTKDFLKNDVYFYSAIVSGSIWVLLLAFTFGYFSALIYNISPIQFMFILWAQSCAVVIYTRSIRKDISSYKCAGLMAFAGTLVWCVSIYGFVVESDWIAASVILIGSFISLIYNTKQIENTEDECYDSSFEQGVLACLHFYCSDLVHLINKIKKIIF